MSRNLGRERGEEGGKVVQAAACSKGGGGWGGREVGRGRRREEEGWRRREGKVCSGNAQGRQEAHRLQSLGEGPGGQEGEARRLESRNPECHHPGLPASWSLSVPPT